MSLTRCTECESIEGRVNGKKVDGEIIDVCGECGAENSIQNLSEDDPREER